MKRLLAWVLVVLGMGVWSSLLWGATLPTPEAPRLVAQTGHWIPDGQGNGTTSIADLAASPNGKIFATGSADNTTKLWDVPSGRVLRTLSGHSRWVLAVAFHPNGTMVASGSADTTIKLWDVASGRELSTLIGHSDAVLWVAFSPDGRTLVSAGDKAIRLWDVANGRELFTLSGQSAVSAFSPDGKMLASAGEDKTIRLWDAATGRELRTIKWHQEKISQLAFAQDGKILVACCSDKTLKLWDAFTGLELRSIAGHAGEWRHGILVSPNDRTIVFSRGGNAMVLQDIASGKELHMLGANLEHVSVLAFSHDGKMLISVGANNAITFWDVSTGREMRRFSSNSDGVSSGSYSADGKTLLSVGRVHLTRLWKLENGTQVLPAGEQFDAKAPFAFSEDGKVMVSGSSVNTIKRWDVAAGKDGRTLAKLPSAINGLAFSFDGKIVMSKTKSNVISLWDVATGQELRAFKGDAFVVNSFTMSRDSSKVAADDRGSSIVLWDVSSGEKLQTLDGQAGWVMSLVFSPDGKTLVAGTEGANSDWVLGQTGDGQVHVWDLGSNQPPRRLIGHAGGVRSVAVSNDGRIIASGGLDNSVKLWDAVSGRELRDLSGHWGGVRSVYFSPDGSALAAVGFDSTVKLWNVATGQLLATLVGFNDGQWAVTTPDGRYDSSNNGATPYLHWVVGNTPISLDQLKDRYYEPGLLAKVMGFNQEALRPVPNLADALVKLFPEVSAKVSEQQPNRLEITLTDQGGGFGRVRVRVNEKEIVADARGGQALTGKTAKLSVDIDPALLLPGDNPVEVVAWNQDEILRSWPAQLSLNGAKAKGGFSSDEAARAPAVPPTLYAIVVGTSKFAAPPEAQMNLNYAGKDAKDFAQALLLGGTRLFGVEKVKLHLFTDQAAASQPAQLPAQLPARSAIEAAFAEVAKEAKPSDILVVYFSGHGVMSPGADGEYHYLTREAQGLNLADPVVRKLWGIGQDELFKWVQQIKTAKQVLVLDTCAAGTVTDKLATQKSFSPDQIRALGRLHERSGFHILAGAVADQTSWEATRYGQGLLTHALLNGIKGAALDNGGYVDVLKLFEYSADEVPILAKGIGRVQRPRLYTQRGNSFYIGQLGDAERKQVPVANARPMLIRANFQDENRYNDHLQLSRRFNLRLAEDNYRVARGSLGYVDTDEFPDAWSVNGRYEQVGKAWKLKARLFLDGQLRQTLETSLPEQPEKQIEPLYQAVRGAIEEKTP